MALVNTPKPSSPSMTNTARPYSFETWATIATTWASETRTWIDTISFIDNLSKPTTSIVNTAKP